MREAALVLVLGGCTSFQTALAEFDSVTQREGAEAEPERLVYAPAPQRYPWLVRQLDGLGVDFLVRTAFQVERSPSPVDNPLEFARERVQIVVAKARGDLPRTALAADRALWVAQVGGDQPLAQAQAVDGIAALLTDLGFDPLALQLPDPTATTETRVAAWLEALRGGWPDQRGASFDGERRTAYAAALAALGERPLPDAADQRALIRALGRGVALERDPELVGPTQEALRRALFHGLALGLRSALFAPAPVVREAAILAFRRLGGVAAVPFVLALVAKAPAAVPSGINRFDDDRHVRLMLVGLCGQLRGDAALRGVGGGPAPIEYLYETCSADADSGLRLVALEALARALGRPIVFEGQWAERWWQDDYVPNRDREPRS